MARFERGLDDLGETTMKRETCISILIIAFGVFLMFWLFVAPVLQPKVANVISEKDMVLAGTAPDGTKLFYQFDEPANPIEAVKPFIPFFLALLPYAFKKIEEKRNGN